MGIFIIFVHFFSLTYCFNNFRYYVIISYRPEEASANTYDAEELRNTAFSELSTKSQALIRTLTGCSVVGRILNSVELIELLYVAYNRDDSEIFGLEKAIEAGYEEIYSTSQDVFEKKRKVIDEQIKDKAIDLANNAIDKVKTKTKIQKMAEEKEKKMDDLISQMAKMILEENKKVVGVELANNAINEIKEEEQKKRGGNVDEKEVKTTERRRTKSNK